jgi:hypothetical protein
MLCALLFSLRGSLLILNSERPAYYLLFWSVQHACSLTTLWLVPHRTTPTRVLSFLIHPRRLWHLQRQHSTPHASSLLCS